MEQHFILSIFLLITSIPLLFFRWVVIPNFPMYKKWEPIKKDSFPFWVTLLFFCGNALLGSQEIWYGNYLDGISHLVVATAQISCLVK